MSTSSYSHRRPSHRIQQEEDGPGAEAHVWKEGAVGERGGREGGEGVMYEA